ncbi:neuromacin-like protein [Physella acuta]|uniref:neuromacin-like protein n=1 Tax=Physella acuta TaxID=109671 RepID=UPI0027DD9619|nr:neuromacin-like protein [Physella acuta]
MAAILKLTFVALLVLMATLPQHSDANVIGSCWDTWSRCSQWSNFFTGKAWLNCNDKCKSLGKRGGTCVLTPSTCPIARQAYQCRCN